MDLRALGDTGLKVSPYGLGTVKFGRNQQVKYPSGFELPTDQEIIELLALARSLGVTVMDTAPAYGVAQQRLGPLLKGQRKEWTIVSKVGESFDGESHFDFSSKGIQATVEQSLKTLNTDYLDAVLIHSDGNDMQIIEQTDAIEAMSRLKERGLIRATGMSTKTVEGGCRCVELLDIVMATFNSDYQDELPVIQLAERENKGVLIKKGLMSGHVTGQAGVEQSFKDIFAHDGVSSVVVGTINPNHLRSNIESLIKVLG